MNAACARKETSIYFALEEPAMQIVRNMRSMGVDLEPRKKKGMLHFKGEGVLIGSARMRAQESHSSPKRSSL